MRSKWKGPFIDQYFIKKHELIVRKKRNNTWRSEDFKFVIRSRRYKFYCFFNNNLL